MIVVSNSTPLIALSKVHRLRLLKDFFNKVWIPTAVVA
jgi:predicted nucleic acid-binding protein